MSPSEPASPARSTGRRRPPPPCEICHRTFTRQEHLQRHLRTRRLLHDETRPSALVSIIVAALRETDSAQVCAPPHHWRHMDLMQAHMRLILPGYFTMTPYCALQSCYCCMPSLWIQGVDNMQQIPTRNLSRVKRARSALDEGNNLPRFYGTFLTSDLSGISWPATGNCFIRTMGPRLGLRWLATLRP